MSRASEPPKLKLPRGSKRHGTLRRIKQWWSGWWFTRMFNRLMGWLYEWWFPVSEHAHDHYGYSGRSRQNRLKWLWRRLQRRTRRSSAGSAFRTVSGALRSRWYAWWYPVSDEGQSRAHYSAARHNRLVRDWRRFSRMVRRSFLGRAYNTLTNWFYDWWYPRSQESHAYPSYSNRRRNRLEIALNNLRRRIRSSWLGRKYRVFADKLLNRWYDWWYPASQHSHAYPSYSNRRRNRLEIALNNLRRRIRSSWLGRKYRAFADAFYEWYFPLEAVGGGYVSHRRVSRPVQFMRRNIRRYRRTWLGRKTGWVLDEVEQLFIQVRIQAAHDFAWHRIQRRLTRWQTWVVLVFLGAAIAFGDIYGVPRYNQYVERNYAMQAQHFVANREYQRAVLRAQQVFTMNPDNPVAIQVIADLADYFGSPYALQWRQRLAALKPDATNNLALARTALRFESFPFPIATKALNDIVPAYRQTAAYQLVAGALAIKLSNLQAAEQHYEEAMKLNPNDPVSRMSLAVIRLQSGNPNVIADSRTTLELLSTDRQIGLLATRSLVAESIAHRDFARAETLSQQILTNRQASFSDRIVHLAILNAEKSARFNSFLDETETNAEQNPFYVGELASWMDHYGFAQEGLNWLNSLPTQITEQGLIPIAIADSYMTLGQWKKLTDYLQKERWNQWDAVRIGMMAFAYRQLYGGEQYSITWQQAMLLAARSPNLLNTLAEMAANWGWKDETADTLWFAAREYPEASWPLTTLEKFYTAQRDTAGLWRVFQAMLKNNPKDPLARNNYAMVSLLLNVDVAAARQDAAELHTLQPENSVFASTYALSLYLQGQPQEAVKALRALGLDRLDDPSLAAYYGVFLSAAGDTKTAKIYLDKSAKAFLLPEEKALVEQAKKGL